MIRVFIAALTMIGVAFAGRGAELLCTVEVDASKVSNVQPDVFTTLQEAMAEFMNTTSFTTAEYSPVEKIECRLFLTVNSYDNNRVEGNLQIQSSRPVYGSAYTTTLLNYKDNDIAFDYIPGDRITHSTATVESQLSALLDFYAALIIGVDNDTFSPRGGDARFAEAANIVNLARTAGEKGWRAIDDNRNRASLLSALQDPSGAAVRDMYYTYHRRGLDMMGLGPDKGRAEITRSLAAISSLNSAAPMSPLLPLVRDAKLDEIINIYSRASTEECRDVRTLLLEVYPTEKKRLEPLLNR